MEILTQSEGRFCRTPKANENLRIRRRPAVQMPSHLCFHLFSILPIHMLDTSKLIYRLPPLPPSSLNSMTTGAGVSTACGGGGRIY